LAQVILGRDENFDSLLRRFNKRVQQDGILSEVRRREYFEKPSLKRKKKEAIKRRKSTKSSKGPIRERS
jgi:small subunit ribosomal protein S21